MGTQNLATYFDYVKDRTFIDKYPASIVKLDELKGAALLEIGCGRFNDGKFLIEKGIMDPDNLFLCEPYIPAFCEVVDRFDGMFGNGYSFRNRHRFCYDRIDENEFPDGFADFVYANNVLHALGYKTLEIELVLRHYEGVPPQEIPEHAARLILTPKQKIKELVKEAHRMLKDKGIFFGRTLSDHIDEDLLQVLEAKEEKSQEEEFAVLTAKAVLEGELIGLSPAELFFYGQEAGFNHMYIEEEPPNWKPRRNFYFRFEK